MYKPIFDQDGLKHILFTPFLVSRIISPSAKKSCHALFTMVHCLNHLSPCIGNVDTLAIIISYERMWSPLTTIKKS